MTPPKEEFPPRVHVWHEWNTSWKRGGWAIEAPESILNKYEVHEYLSLAEHSALLLAAQRERDEALGMAEEWERSANEWMREYDKLKEKYEPMIAVIQAATAPGGKEKE